MNEARGEIEKGYRTEPPIARISAFGRLSVALVLLKFASPCVYYIFVKLRYLKTSFNKMKIIPLQVSTKINIVQKICFP